MQLNNTRLELIYNMIKNECKVFDCFGDVGTDHAHLPVFLLQQGLFRSAIASDVNVLPLKRAEENIRRYGYIDKVTLLLSDGLSKYTKECDVVCIAGLSGTTIISVLEKYLESPWENNPIFLLQPNTAISDTRKFLAKHGFVFKEEQVCIDKKHEYPVIKGYFTDKNDNDTDTVFYHLGLFKDKNDENTERYLNILYKKYNDVIKKISNIDRSLSDREASLLKELQTVTEFIENKIRIQK